MNQASWEIRQGNALDLLRAMPDASVQTCVTSPPYWGLRDYGIAPSVWGGEPDHTHELGVDRRLSIDNSDKRRWNHATNGRGEEQPEEKHLQRKSGEVSQGAFCSCGAWRGALGLEPTPELYVEHMVLIFREVRRVLRGDGTLWLNLGDCYATGAGRVGDAPGGDEQGERWKGNRGTHHAGNSGKHAPSLAEMGPRTQPNRMPLAGLKPKDLVGIPWRVAFALQADGWWLRSDIVWSKPNPMPESVTDRPTKAHEYLFLLAKGERYYYDTAAIREPWADERKGRDYGGDHPRNVQGGTPATPPNAAPHTGLRRGFRPESERNRGGRTDGFTKPNNIDLSANGGRNRRSVWTVATQPFAEAHFATFPQALVEPCVLAGSRPGDLVLDLFAGSGTVGVVALRHGRRFLGLELNSDYCEMARRRIAGPLFAEAT